MSATKNRERRATKAQLSCRVSPVVKELIALERSTQPFLSEGEAVELLVLRASTSDAAQKLMLKEATKDPFFAAALRLLAGKKD